MQTKKAAHQRRKISFLRINMPVLLTYPPVIIPGFLIPHCPFTVPDSGRNEIHNHTDQTQKRQQLVQQLQYNTFRHLRKNIKQCQHGIDKPDNQATEAAQPDLILETHLPIQFQIIILSYLLLPPVNSSQSPQDGTFLHPPSVPQAHSGTVGTLPAPGRRCFQKVGFRNNAYTAPQKGHTKTPAETQSVFNLAR